MFPIPLRLTLRAMSWLRDFSNELPPSSGVPSRVVEVMISSSRSLIPLEILSGYRRHEERVVILPIPLPLTLPAMSWLRDLSNELVPLSSGVPSRVVEVVISSLPSSIPLEILSGYRRHEERVLILGVLLLLTFPVISSSQEPSNELVPISSGVPSRVADLLIASSRSLILLVILCGSGNDEEQVLIMLTLLRLTLRAMSWSQGLSHERVLSSEVPSRVLEVMISSSRSLIPLEILSGYRRHEEQIVILPTLLRLTLRAMSWSQGLSHERVLSSEVPSRVVDLLISFLRSLTILAILSGSGNHEERILIVPTQLPLTLLVMSWSQGLSNELVPPSSGVPSRVVETLISSSRSLTLMGSIFVVSRT